MIVGPIQAQMDDFCDLHGTPDTPVSRIVTVKGFYDRLLRLGLPLKCNTNKNEKSESTRLLKKLKLRPYCS